ncbi:hypothetical protein ACFV4P_20430 [Kitasatospora sp. NPDC059795]
MNLADLVDVVVFLLLLAPLAGALIVIAFAVGAYRDRENSR